MQVLSNGRVRRSPDEWREIVRRFAGSGRNPREFCRQEKINPASFQRWQKRLASSKQSDFVEITPIEKSSPSWAVEVELANGTIVRIGS